VTTIAVVDHGAGNLVSIAQGLERVGATVVVATDPSGLAGADALVLPGVGTTRGVMDGIDAGGFRSSIEGWDRPLLGICVGMQVLFASSDEDDARCFGFLPGKVELLEDAPRLPHIGWNDVAITDDPLFAGLGADPTFYFVHSYAPTPDRSADVIGTATYGRRFTAAVRSGQRMGTQFHPERSGENGIQLLANFVAMIP
jgi:glutamine amidotransferase